MNRKVIKNMTKMTIRNHFRHRDVIFKPKASKGFDMDKEEDKAEYHFWMQTYGFMRDITALLEGGDTK